MCDECIEHNRVLIAKDWGCPSLVQVGGYAKEYPYEEISYKYKRIATPWVPNEWLTPVLTKHYSDAPVVRVFMRYLHQNFTHSNSFKEHLEWHFRGDSKWRIGETYRIEPWENPTRFGIVFLMRPISIVDLVKGTV